jgi:phthiocerol/phenolphthiocerol synthesis type-I polyketide synthase E
MSSEPIPAASMGQMGQMNVTDNVTGQLTQIWQEILHIDSITPDQNYFDLGGDSSLAVLLFAKIEAIFGVELPLATLFEAPTIQELARVLHRDAPSEDGWSPLVAIQPSGSRPNFFCVHGAGGNVLIYRDLALRLGPDQPFYGLQCPGLEGACPPLTKIEDMATLYVKEIRKKQPRGPYFLGGYCMGGTVAYEVAQQIQAQGEQVALLALFDTMDFSKFPHLSTWDTTYQSLQRLVFHGANFLRLDWDGKTQFLKGKGKVFRSRIPVWRGMLAAKFSKGSGTEESRLLANIWQTNDRACVNYFPKPFAGTITDFRPVKQYRVFDKPGAKWDELAKGGQEIVVLPTYPAGMLVEPFVKHLAVALQKSMDEAIRKYGTR